MSICSNLTSIRSIRAVRTARLRGTGNSGQCLPMSAARATRRSRFIDGARIEKPSVHSGAHELLDLDSRNPRSGGGLGPIFREQRAGDIVAVVRAILGMARRHAVAVAIKHHAGEEAG